jgi:pyrroline-5-carboxylate reductase
MPRLIFRSLGDIKTTLDNKEVVKSAQIVFLCVKPACLESVASSLSKKLYDNPEDHMFFATRPHNTLVSILAGTSLHLAVKKAIPFFKSYVRAMPNTPLQVQAGCTAITKFNSDDDSCMLHYEAVLAIFGSLGIVAVVEESKFHAITAVSGECWC